MLAGRQHDRRGLRVIADVGHLINAAARAAAADRDVKAAIGADFGIGGGEAEVTFWRDKGVRCAGPAAAEFAQRHGEHATEGPIQDEQGAAIVVRELRVLVADDARRRAATKRRNDTRHVEIMIGLDPILADPAGAAAGERVHHANRPIPGERDFPLAVAVEDEEVARPVDGKVVRIAEAVGDDFASRQIGPQSQNAAGPRLLDRRTLELHVVGRDARVVADHHVPPAVGAALHGVRVVFAAGLQFQKDVGGSVGPIVGVGVPIANQAGIARADQVAAAKAHALCAAGRAVGELFVSVGDAVVIGVDQDPHVTRTGDDDATEGVEREREDVVSQLVVSVLRDGKSGRRLQVGRVVADRPVAPSGCQEHCCQEQSRDRSPVTHRVFLRGPAPKPGCSREMSERGERCCARSSLCGRTTGRQLNS